MSVARWDCVVLGAGHNGLVLQAYLARAGLATCAVERRAGPGGPLVTEPDPVVPGVLHNPHAVFLRGIRAMPWFSDLALDRRGVDLIEPDLNYCQLTSDGRAVRIFLDLDRTCEALAELSPADAVTYRRLHEQFTPVLEHVVALEVMAPPLPAERRRALLGRSRIGRLALETEPLSAREFVERHFQHPALRAGLLYVGIIREVDVLAPGHGLLVPTLIASRHKAQLCRGGSAALARGLAAAVAEAGGVILTGRTPRRILLERGRVSGVELDDGQRLGCRAVVSTLSPRQTFVDLLGPECPGDLARASRAYRYNLVGPLCGLNVALREPPRYRAAERRPEIAGAGLTVLGLDGPEEIYALYQGRIPSLGSLWGTVPTGDLGAGWLGPGQMGADRPFPGAGGYRTPVPGLYLAGGATHPGGNITGLPGYNAAQVVVRDFGLKPFWDPPDPEAHWARLP